MGWFSAGPGWRGTRHDWTDTRQPSHASPSFEQELQLDDLQSSPTSTSTWFPSQSFCRSCGPSFSELVFNIMPFKKITVLADEKIYWFFEFFKQTLNLWLQDLQGLVAGNFFSSYCYNWGLTNCRRKGLILLLWSSIQMFWKKLFSSLSFLVYI